MITSEKQYKQRISLGQSNNAVMGLVAINLVVFVGLMFMKAVWHYRYQGQPDILVHYNNEVLSWFALSSDGSTLLQRPWTLISHMFSHDSFWKIFANMLWLWVFGYIMQDLTGNKKIVPVYLYGALVGAGTFLLFRSFNPTPADSLMGASAGVMAVAVATTVVCPGYRIFPLIKGGLPLWILTVIYLASDLLTQPLNDPTLLFTHIAGGVTGFIFIALVRMGFDASEWMNNFYDWVNNLFNPDKPKKGALNIKDELFYSTSVPPYKKTPNLTQQRVDEILDKISREGYHFLTEEEKELLKRASKEDI